MPGKINLHTHTKLCHHAEGTVDDYCRSALQKGGRVLGVSDHTPLPDNRWSYVRMAMSDLDGYCNEIEQAKAKYKQLEIFKSFECDYDPDYENFYQEVLLNKYKADYLVGAVHWFPHSGEYPCVYGGVNDRSSLTSYTRTIIKAISSGLFLFIAHPDLFAGSYIKWDKHAENSAREIVKAAQAYDVALEINDLGYRKPWIKGEEGSLRPMYPYLPFWQIVSEYSVKVTLNSDAHTPAEVYSHQGAQFFYKQAKLVNPKLDLG